MARDVDEYVADNRQKIRRIDARAVQVDARQTETLNFGESTVTIDVDVEVYSRTTGSQLIFGHPDPDHGFGRGTFGDDRGGWSLETDVEATAQFTKQGRKAIAEALDGQTGAIDRGVMGVGTAAAATTDTSLATKTGDGNASTSKDAYNVTRGTFNANAVDTVGSEAEFGLIDGSGRLLCRVTIDPANTTIANDDEIRADVILTFTGDGIGKSVITNDGEEAIADSIAKTGAAVGPATMEFGTGDTDFSKTDTSLTSKVFDKPVDRAPGRDRVTASTHIYKIDTEADPSLTDPHSHDLTEMNLLDNNGRMIWATTFRTVTKDEDTGVDARTTIIAI